MVRLQRKIIKKKYMSKSVYECAKYFFYFPKKFNNLLEPLMGVELEVDAKQEGGKLIVTLQAVRKPRNFSS